MLRDNPTFLKSHTSSFVMPAPATATHAGFSETVVKVKELRFIRATGVKTDRATGKPVIKEAEDAQQQERFGRCRYADQLWVFKTESGKTFSLLLRSIEDAKEFAKYIGIEFDNFHPVREELPVRRMPKEIQE